LLAALALGSAPLSAGDKVLVDWATDYDFAAASTITWAPGTPARSEAIESRIRESIVAHLESDGLTFVAAGGRADLIAVTHAVGDTALRESGMTVGVGVGVGGPQGSVGVGRSTGGKPKKVKVGSLVIEIRDGLSGRLLWQGVVQDTFKGDAAKIEKKVGHYVDKALEKYPPPS
jgi:hypothetical protein